jgi:hypothetical protein
LCTIILSNDDLPCPVRHLSARLTPAGGEASDRNEAIAQSIVMESRLLKCVLFMPQRIASWEPPIGANPDGAGFDSGLGLAFASNGGDGTLSIVKPVNGKYETVDTVPTERGARTMTVDSKNHRVYLLAAEFGPTPQAAPGTRARPQILPDTFHVLVVGRQ